MSSIRYHIGFGPEDIDGTDVAILCGDPERAEKVARQHLTFEKVLSTNRALNSFVGVTPGGKRIVSATSGMGAPSTSIVVNELAQVGIRHIVRVGTTAAVIAARDEAESVAMDVKAQAEEDAIRVAVAAVDGIDPGWLDAQHRW